MTNQTLLTIEDNPNTISRLLERHWQQKKFLMQKLASRGIGVLFSRQADRLAAFKGQRAIAAEKGKTRRRFLLE